MNERCVLGIDPGTRLLGYAILRGEKKQNPQFLLADVEVLTRISDPYARLARIHELVLELIDHYAVSELAVEAPFYGKNAQSMLKLGRAQGVALAAALSRGIPAQEYSPRRVKEVVTTTGQATKGQVAQILRRIFPSVNFDQLKTYDATDALAIALCHFYTAPLTDLPHMTKKTSPQAKGNKTRATSWTNFVASNPDRVVNLEYTTENKETV